MKLHQLRPAKGAVKSSKRIGRGQGSGRGGTATRGHNGAQSRSGYSQKLGFEGGQMPLQRRVPKFGFKNPGRVAYKPINLDTLQELATKKNTNVIDVTLLAANGLAGKGDLIKVLNRGELTMAIEVTAHKFSASAKESIEKAGGKVTTL